MHVSFRFPFYATHTHIFATSSLCASWHPTLCKPSTFNGPFYLVLACVSEVTHIVKVNITLLDAWSWPHFEQFIIALYIGHTGYCIMLTNNYSGIQCLPSVNYQTIFFPLHILEMHHIMEINWLFMLISRPKLYITLLQMTKAWRCPRMRSLLTKSEHTG